jgi:uncharacterized YigZ family protein
MLEEYRTLLQAGMNEIIIEKSRFIGYSAPVSSEEEAIIFIDSIKNKHSDATHNVRAYVIGLGNEIQRYSDDGEPSGTAGIPVLEVMKKADVRNAAIVVTRYFGGIKLGAGGLVRAYSKAGKTALDSGIIIMKRYYQILQIKIEYTLLGKIQNDLLQKGYFIKEIQYDEAVHLTVCVKNKEIDSFREQIIEWTNDKCEIFLMEKKYLGEQNGKLFLP